MKLHALHYLGASLLLACMVFAVARFASADSWVALWVPLVVAGVGFGLSMVTEIITTGVGLGTSSGAGDFVRLILQPPYIIGAVIFVVIVAMVVRGVIRVVRALGRAMARRPAG